MGLIVTALMRPMFWAIVEVLLLSSPIWLADLENSRAAAHFWLALVDRNNTGDRK